VEQVTEASSQPTTVRKRDGKTTQPFVAEKIEKAIRAAWLEAEGVVDEVALRKVTTMAVASLPIGVADIETIQDSVETSLMRLQKFAVAKAFILFRQKRAEARAARKAQSVDGMSPFAHKIMTARYAHKTASGSESWKGVARRVATNVMGAVNSGRDLTREVRELIAERKFMPGGRYLYASGRDFHQTQNCLLLKAEDSREGWAEHINKVMMASMTGAGVGGVYSFLREKGSPVKRTGGVSSGPIALMQATNEVARSAGQGGSRRAALWAGLHWNHPDVHDFIKIKDWSPDIVAMKEKDFSAVAPMDYTNVSVILDDAFFAAYHDAGHAKNGLAHEVYWKVVRSMLKSGEPGFSIDVGSNAGEHNRNACVIGKTEILTDDGYKRIDSLVGQKVRAWNGFEWSEVEPRVTGHDQQIMTVKLSSGQELTVTPTHDFWLSTNYTGGTKKVQAQHLKLGDKLIKHDYPVIEHGASVDDGEAYTQGFLSGDGMDDYTFMFVYDTKYMCLPRMSLRNKPLTEGRDKTSAYFAFAPRLKAFVPFVWNLRGRLNWLAGLLDSDGTELIEGGTQIGSVNKAFLLSVQKLLTTMGVASKISSEREEGYRPLPDGKGGTALYFCQTLYRLMISAAPIQKLKDMGLRCERLSFIKDPNRDASRFVTITGLEEAGVAEVVYCFTEPKRNLGCFEGVVTGQCTEITSADDSDICNLGSINLARIESLSEMQRVVEVTTAFLLAGTVYSDLPYDKVRVVREKNRRLGLGLMGIHEWLLARGHTYGPCEELVPYLDIYARSTEYAHAWAKRWDLSLPVKTRAVAPTGTIGIVAETTTGAEPIYAAAFKRRYFDNGVWRYQYVLDPTAKKLVAEGIDPNKIEDAYSLAEDPGRRVAFQAWLQGYVDHGISSTINLPAWGTPFNCEARVQDFGDMLITHLPNLRGITVYPDGARGGQPLSSVSYREAAGQEGEVFTESIDVCDLTRGGSCGA
jgi:ribonucleotide reductase alpha subunit